MVKKSKVDKFIESYCADNGIILLIDPKLDKNDGLCYIAPYKEIHLAQRYSASYIKLACFLHEAAHLKVDRFKNKPYNLFECEYYSWFEAMQLHKKHFGKSFTKKQAEYMLKCLKTYCQSQYEFRKA